MKRDKEFFNSLLSQFASHNASNINFSSLICQYLFKADGSSNGRRRIVCVKDLIDKDLTKADVGFFSGGQKVLNNTCVPSEKDRKKSCAVQCIESFYL